MAVTKRMNVQLAMRPGSARESKNWGVGVWAVVTWCDVHSTLLRAKSERVAPQSLQDAPFE